MINCNFNDFITKLFFRYWELSTSDTVKPYPVEKCLPSDCRYREDSIAFGKGDLDLS